jgi:hypothetical protein
MSSTESSGAPAEATATSPAPAAEFPSFGSTRGSGLARGKRPTSGPSASTATAPSDYKPTAIEVVNAPREYTNPFAPAESQPAAVETPAPVVTAPVIEPAIETPRRESASVVPAPAAPAESAESAEKAEINILPPAEAKTSPAQTWESDGFRPARESRNDRPRREEPAAEEDVDVASIPSQFLYVRPGVKFVPTPRNWGGAPRERNRPAADGAPVAREQAPRSSEPAAPAPAPAAPSGGIIAWFKSLFGGSPAATPITAGNDGDARRDGGGHRRHRGGRGRGPGGEGAGHRRSRGGRNRHRHGGEPEGSRQGGI